MASRLLDALSTVGTHNVGNVSSWKIRVVPYGAVVTGAPVDNFTLVELGFDAEGERTCTQLSAVTKKGYLIAAPERRYVDGEQLSDFYNGVGDRARIVFLDEGLRFDTSAYSLNAGVADTVAGYVAHFDPATKKFIISNPASAHASYATAVDKFYVVASEDEVDYLIDGQPLVRLEKQA
jgi:hypothetical protein